MLRIDITPMVSQSNPVSSAHLVMFSPTAVDQLIVVTSSGDRSRGGLLKFSASNGQLLSEVCSHIQYIVYTVHHEAAEDGLSQVLLCCLSFVLLNYLSTLY